MALPTTCSSSPPSQYRSHFDALHVMGDEEAQVLPILSQLDGLDGACDGQVPPVSYDSLKLAAEKVAGLNLPPQRRVAIRNALMTHLQADDFAVFIARPYHEVLQFLTRNPIFADTLLPHIQPKGLWSDELEKMVQIPDAYPQLVDALYARSGVPQLNTLIDKADRVRLHESVGPRDDVSLSVKKNETRTESTTQLLGMIDLQPLPDLMRVNPALLPMLRTQKANAEAAFATTLFDKIDSLPEAMKKDPLTYWIPLVKLASSELESADSSNAHYGVLQSLYVKARALAYDDVMGVLFDVEFAEYTGDPMDIAKLDSKIGDIRKKITEVTAQQYILPNGQTESSVERVGRYYSAIGHLLTRKYAVAISAMTPNILQIMQIENEVGMLLQERRDKTTVDEALVYADTVNIIVSAWAAEGGMMTQKVMMEGLPAASKELTRLAMFQKRFETLCNGHYQVRDGGGLLLEKMADIRWKVYGESYFRAGLPKQGLDNLESEHDRYSGTKVYSAHIEELRRQYPWLVNEDGKIIYTQVGEHGEKAEAITEALFYASRETGREVGLPLVGAVAGSLAGPVGTVAGGYAGKAINHFINNSSDEAEKILLEARATGIPFISESLSEQLAHAEYIDLASCGVSSLLMFRFYRSAVSLTRAASQASYKYVMHGGLQATARASAQRLTLTSLQTAGRGLGSRTLAGIKSLPTDLSAIPGKIVETYGKAGVWPTIKYSWNNYGVRIRLATSAGLLGSDYFPDRTFNTWAGPLGASLLINDVYGKAVWGWNANGGMVGFVWRYGFELGVQAMQGIPISKPRMDYTVMGMLASYTLRGVNKLYTLGRAETHASPVIQGVTHFVEEHDVLVPRSVVGLTRIKALYGMVRGLALRIGKPARALSADLPDGTILRVVEVQKTATHYVVHVVRKMTGTSGRPVEVITERLQGAPIEEVTEMTLPRASFLGRLMYRTVHERLSDAGVYRVPNAVMKVFNIQPKWWVTLGQRVTTPARPIFNFRGSLANAGDLPLLALAGSGFGVLQDSDPQMTGLYRAADYGIAFFFQHKVQHLFKIDSALGTFVGYALGTPIAIFSLPKIFPTVINKAPALTKKCNKEKAVFEILDTLSPCDEGYFASLEMGDPEGANQALQLAVTSLSPLANAPVVGPYVWNKVTPFGAVKDSNYRIEEVGAVAYWRTMSHKLEECGSNEKAQHVMALFIDKVARDCHRYLVMHDLPEDPVKLRLLVLELAFVKRLMRDKTHPDLMRHAAAYPILKEASEHVPTIRTEASLRQMITGLNINESVGVTKGSH